MEITELPLKGKVFKSINIVSAKDSFSGGDTIYFLTEDYEVYEMVHDQDCCEVVVIDDISGNLQDLIGTPLTMAEEVYERDSNGEYGSTTWTFYKFATNKGYVAIRWYGCSNGYYSETVELRKIEVDDKIITDKGEDTKIRVIISNFFNEYEVQKESREP